MKKLRNKVFIVIVTILSIVLLVILSLVHINLYNREYKSIINKMDRISNNNDFFSINIEGFTNPIFIDNEIYIVNFSTDGSIKKIINFSNSEVDENFIEGIIKANINKIKSKKKTNLYFDNYAFRTTSSGDLIILNCEQNRYSVLSNLRVTIIFFVSIEAIIVYLSIIITKWIVKPVIESFAKQKQFIYDASHELKTPISIISASAETLEENPNEKKWLQNIKEESLRMNKLVTNLLDLSKSEDIKEKETFSTVNLSKVIKNKSMSFESLLFENNLKLDLDIDNDITFNCASDRIKELLSIFIDNAIKHSYDNSTIKVSLHKEKNIIVLSVTNRGDEIPEAEREKIFERFYRIDKARNRSENRYGLGLSIAKNIALSHNGIIKVKCKNGYTTFEVNFKQN